MKMKCMTGKNILLLDRGVDLKKWYDPKLELCFKWNPSVFLGVFKTMVKVNYYETEIAHLIIFKYKSKTSKYGVR